MADYRLSAQVISRGKGQSCVASAAYRAASRLVDERTGEIHDYGRKSGVVYSEILAPGNAPDWMRDRAQLWNAVEAVERRKDAQLAREIQLSLPHELTADQRRDLVRGFVHEQFVNQGMIADIAIHAPGKNGDDRNHHAHIMLTMRELAGNDFGKKQRDWNDPERLQSWRAEWSRHQNRELERHGHDARVDHRSYEDQGIDREPTNHLGPIAHKMEQGGRPSRIGDENRAVDDRNAERADRHRDAAVISLEIEREKRRFEGWANSKRAELESGQQLSAVDLGRKHQSQTNRLEARIDDVYGESRRTLQQQAETISRRMDAKGVRRILRNVFGGSRSDRIQLENLNRTLADIKRREDGQRAALAARQANDRTVEDNRQQARKNDLERRITKARDRREDSGWKPLQKRTEKPQERDRPDFRAEPHASPQPAPEPEKTLEQKAEVERQEKRDSSLSYPWEKSAFSNDNDRMPWENDYSRPGGRTRGRASKPDRSDFEPD